MAYLDVTDDTDEASSYACADSNGFQLLDAMVDKYAAASLESSDTKIMEKSVILASLSQQTAMLITNPVGPWASSLTSIIRQAEGEFYNF